MGVSIAVEWPGSSQERQDAHPGFQNDDHMWANWTVNMIGKSKHMKALRDLGGEVLLYHNTPGLPAEEMGWARPEDCEKSALAIRDLVAAKDRRMAPLIEIYRIEWDRLIGEVENEKADDRFIGDLEDVAQIAR